MITLIALAIFGLGAAYFATQNTTPVTVTIGTYLWPNIPLYLLIIGSFLLGIAICWVASSADRLSTALTLRHDKKLIQELEQKVTDRTKRIHELELENTKIKGKSGRPTVDDTSL